MATTVSAPKQVNGRRDGDSVSQIRKFIQGGAVAREDSDDELGDDDIPWEWIWDGGSQPDTSILDDSVDLQDDVADEVDDHPTRPIVRKRGRPAKRGTKMKLKSTVDRKEHAQRVREAREKRIIGARLGRFECHVGDTVLLKADQGRAWVAIVCSFFEETVEKDDGLEDEVEKMANFMWFSGDSEIRNEKKRRADKLEEELYITPSWDNNPLTAINGRASVLSPSQFAHRFPTGKIAKSSKDYGKTFVCRFGCNVRKGIFSPQIDWPAMMKLDEPDGKIDIAARRDMLGRLIEFVQNETAGKRSGMSTAPTTNGKTTTTSSVREKIARVKAKMKTMVQETPRKNRTRKRPASDDDEFEDGIESNDGISSDQQNGLTTPRKRQRTAEPTSGNRRKRTTTPNATPTTRRVARRPLEFTPLGSRMLPAAALQSPFQLARRELHVGTVPMALPCREDEFATVFSTLERAISDGAGACIYIAGTPGTGKTATVREVVAQLQTAVIAEELDDFVFVEINGMKVTEPAQSYVLLWEALHGERVSPGQAIRLLEAEFSRPSPRRVPCVVLMDELDQLVTSDQRVMYNFFNWPGLAHSRLIVLAVANTMDLPERTLSNKISSRLGLHRITFSGYSHEQLIEIIETRLAAVPGQLVHPDAIQFAARKVAAVSGDARRALDICRRAVEIAEEQQLERAKKVAEEDAADEAEMAAAAETNFGLVDVLVGDMSIIHEVDEDDEPDENMALPTITIPSKNQIQTRRTDGSSTTTIPQTPSKRSRIVLPTTPLKPTPLHERAKLKAIPHAVTIATIKQAITEATESAVQQAVRALPVSAKIFLAGLLCQMRRSGVSESTLGEVVDEARRIAIVSVGPSGKNMGKSGNVGFGSDRSAISDLIMISNPQVDVEEDSDADQPVVPISRPARSDSDPEDSDEDEYSSRTNIKFSRVRFSRSDQTPARPTLQASNRTAMSTRSKSIRPGWQPRMIGLRDAAEQLLDAGIVALESRRGERIGRVRLAVPAEEVTMAMRSDAELVGVVGIV